MKNTRPISFLIAFLLLSITMSAQTWTRTYLSQTDYKTKVFLKGPDTIFVLGWSNFLTRSFNHGKTWVEYFLPYMEVHFNDMHFINNDIGFIVADNYGILRTTNAGDKWLLQTSGGSKIKAISSANPNSIWVVGEKGLVLFSNDLGVTWQPRDFGTTQNLNDVSFKNERGIIVGDSGTCFRTSDWGQNWNKVTIDASQYTSSSAIQIGNLTSISQTESYDYVFNVGNGFSYPLIVNDTRKFAPNGLHFKSYTFINDTTGYAIYTSSGWPRYFYIYKTTDGITWNIAFQTPDEFADGGPYCLSVVNEQVGWAIANSQLFSMFASPSTVKEAPKSSSSVSLLSRNNEIVLMSKNTGILSVEVFSISGISQVRLQNIQVESEIHIDASTYPKGIYLIHTILTSGERNITKWLKQ